MSKIIERVIQRLPNPERMREIDVRPDEVRFLWCDTRFRVSENYFVEEVLGGCLVCTNGAALLQALLRRTT